MNSPLVYVAGPLFDEGERWWIETIEARIAAHGLSTFLPHRDNPDKTPDNTLEIFRNDRDAIDRCDLVVANLNGITTDDGTAWERLRRRHRTPGDRALHRLAPPLRR